MKALKLLQRNLLYILLCVVFAFGCSKQPKITKKDIMNAFTIGWNKGYQEGLRQGFHKRENAEWTESSFIQDSCSMELHLSGVK